MTQDEYRQFDAFSCADEMAHKLYELGFYVKDNADEFSALQNANKTIKAALGQEECTFVILTTTKCNAHCYYCYEQGIPAQDIRTKDVIQICSFIEGKCNLLRTNGLKKLSIQWFGGEPLLNPTVIATISKRLIAYCEANGIEYAADIVTNGSLLTEGLARSMHDDWLIHSCQISLDGTKEIYEQAKDFAFPDAFEQALAAIRILATVGVRVSVRLNYDGIHHDDVVKLIAILHEQQSMYKYTCKVYYKRLYGKNENASLFGDYKIIDALYDAGFYRPGVKNFKRRAIACGAVSPSYYVINPDGTVHKCTHLLNNDKLSAQIGNLSDCQDKMFPEKWLEYAQEEKCEKCAFLPICMGGCLAQRKLGNYACYYNARIVEYHLMKLLTHKTQQSNME